MKCLSLFTGAGGIDLALKRAGHTIIGACEIDKYARSIYSRHFPGIPIHEDATKIMPEKLPDFDILVAGFPCQPFSNAGKKLGFEESRGTLFFEIARIVKQKRPRLLLLENVKGLLSAGFNLRTGFFEATKGEPKGELTEDSRRVKNEPERGWNEITKHITKGECFFQILASLDELGYDAEWQVLNSKYFVPQTRERIFIIFHLRGTPRPQVFPIRESSEEFDGRNAKEQVANSLQGPGHSCGNYKGMTMIYMSQKNSNMKQRTQVRNTSWTLTNNSSDFGIIEPKLKQLNETPHDTGRIYDSTGIARALRANSGGMGSKTGLYQTDRKVRRLTPLECERLQSFPDRYTEGLSDTQRYKCLGNAVTVSVIDFILERLT